MSLIVKCPTDYAVLLCAVPDERGVLRFPSNDSTELPGLNFAVEAGLPINDQLIQVAEKTLNARLHGKLDVSQDFADPVVRVDGQPATLYVATVAEGAKRSDSSWPSLPEILRALPKNKGRVPYLRAWQILTGGLKLDTKAVDMADVERHFRDDN